MASKQSESKARSYGWHYQDQSGQNFTPDQWEALLAHFGYKCLACGAVEDLTADHVISRRAGGSNTIDNIQPLCFSCNASKNRKCIDYRSGAPVEYPDLLPRQPKRNRSIGFGLTVEQKEALDSARGTIPVSIFVRSIILKHIGYQPKQSSNGQHG